MRRQKARRIPGTCIAGTVDEPRVWYRNRPYPHTPLEYFGRENHSPDPRLAFECGVTQDAPISHCRMVCPAYRYPKGGYNGMDRKGEPIAFTEAEYKLFLDDGEAFYATKEVGHTLTGMVRTFTQDTTYDGLPVEMYDVLTEMKREKSREWRAAHPGYDKRARGHRDRAAYMREYRKRNPTVHVSLARLGKLGVNGNGW